MTVVLACVVMCVVSAVAQAEAPCPNEALRQELRSGALPDCRAYEVVSPMFRDGATFDFGRAAISGAGSHVIAQALGSFAGTGSESYSNTEYELSRTSTGWVADALDPSGSASPESNFFAASADLTRTLWGLHRPSQSIYEEDLYVREPDGRFIEIGPMVPPSFASGPPSGTTTTFGRGPLIHTLYNGGGGASADLSHVLVDIKIEGAQQLIGARWPGDLTVGENDDSLYEYAGTGVARPELVGVTNEDRQISNCGTELGSAQFGDKYNAVSASGATIFFTAEAGGCTGLNQQKEEIVGAGPKVNELYARIDGVETVPISEPSFSQCRECRTGTATPEEPAVAEQPAEFRGASDDGSKVFFTTEQELFAGQTTENLYEYDFGNSKFQNKVVLASVGSATPEVQGMARVSEDGSHVYFVAKGVLTTEPDLSLAPGHQVAVAGEDNLYVFERDAAHTGGRVRFIATLPEADAQDWSAEDERPVEATPDGRFVVFTSVGDSHPGRHEYGLASV